jgi:hypothetical protein
MTALDADLARFAASDLRLARKQGDALIGQTRLGTLSLRYDAGHYSLTTTGIAPTVIAEGKAATVKAALADCYLID